MGAGAGLARSARRECEKQTRISRARACHLDYSSVSPGLLLKYAARPDSHIRQVSP